MEGLDWPLYWERYAMVETPDANKEGAMGVSGDPCSFWILFNVRRGRGGDGLELIDDKKGQFGLPLGPLNWKHSLKSCFCVP